MTRPLEHRDGFQINRFLSRPVSALLLKTPVTPNHVTLASLFFGMLSGFLFSKGAYAASVAGAFVFVFAAVLDNCDGEIARAKKMGSVFGAWLDIVTDVFKDLAFFTGLAWGVLGQGALGPVHAAWLLCVGGSILNFAIVILQKTRGFGPAVFNQPNPEGTDRQNVWYKITEALREGDSVWLVVLLALFGRTDWLLWAGAVYVQVLWISAISLNFRWLFTQPLYKTPDNSKRGGAQ
ncbi:MAG: CDP-alcohol phosphatidyltransferase family protein [Candidatus Omnitrophota bacterium]